MRILCRSALWFGVSTLGLAVLTGVVGAGRVGKLMKARQFLVTPTPVATLLEG